MDNRIVWADIPVADLERAIEFCSAVTQREFTKIEGMPGVALPAPEGFGPASAEPGLMPVTFDLAVVEDRRPSADGCTVYLNSQGDAEGMLQRAADAGGETLMPATDMGQMIGSIGFSGIRKEAHRCAQAGRRGVS